MFYDNLKKEHVGIPLHFDEKLFTDYVDTGRLIVEQLRNANQKYV